MAPTSAITQLFLNSPDRGHMRQWEVYTYRAHLRLPPRPPNPTRQYIRPWFRDSRPSPTRTLGVWTNRGTLSATVQARCTAAIILGYSGCPPHVSPTRVVQAHHAG